MNVVRGLERRLELLLEGIIGRAFSGALHPSEIASRLAREAEFARFDHPAGPATANSFALTFNPSDLPGDQREFERLLSDEITAYTADQGLRMEGPATVSVNLDEGIPTGQMTCHVEVVPGPSVPWANLVSSLGSLPIGRNRVLVGRAPDMDVIIEADDVSRRHAAIWRQGGIAYVRDLASSNGTRVDGVRIAADPVPLEHGSTIGLSEHTFRFLISDA